MALMSVSGSTWKDPEGNAWLSPYASDATEYLTAVVKECADLGFEEIVLDDVQFRITAGRSALYMSRGKTAMRAALRRSMLFWMR